MFSVQACYGMYSALKLPVVIFVYCLVILSKGKKKKEKHILTKQFQSHESSLAFTKNYLRLFVCCLAVNQS